MNIVLRPVVEDGVHRYLPKSRKRRLAVANSFKSTAVVDEAVVEGVGPESKEKRRSLRFLSTRVEGRRGGGDEPERVRRRRVDGGGSRR